MKLKYLFTAIYDDGTVYAQNPEDKSLLKDFGSSYSDVNQEKLIAFILEDQIGSGKVIGVNLLDGHFEIDGFRMLIHQEKDLTNFRLIFFRRHVHKIRQSDGVELSHDWFYRIGWQANDSKGNNVQRIIEIE